MEIRFSTARRYPEDDIWKAAKDNACHARIKWATTAACRFILTVNKDSYDQADFATQDKVLLALLTLDPAASIRTAKANINGLADFHSQVRQREGVQ